MDTDLKFSAHNLILGQESQPQFAETSQCSPKCSWSLYKSFQGSFAHSVSKQQCVILNCQGRNNMTYDNNVTGIFAPSIVAANQFSTVQEFFGSSNISVGGFFEWKQRAQWKHMMLRDGFIWDSDQLNLVVFFDTYHNQWFSVWW